MAKLKKHGQIYSYLMIIIGTGILAFGIQCFYDQVGLVTGGFSGLAIIVKNISSYFWEGGIPLWFTNLALNIPVFILSYFLKGWKFIGKTFFGTIMLSVWLYIIPAIDMAEGDYMIAAIFGGVCAGAGIGFVIKVGATTGGTDMVSALVQLKLRHYSIVQILQVIDAAVVVMGLVVFGMRPTLYAIIGIVVQTKVADLIVEGFNYSKATYIISDKHEIVAERIMRDLDRGLTGLEARGMYTGTNKRVLMCILNQKELVNLKNLVNEVDPEAFVIVSDVREVLGEGFQEYKQEF
ncbi:MAG: YitT family protein [Agathobacter sp.]|nr:YitT family protein [Agathobacter sp.]